MKHWKGWAVGLVALGLLGVFVWRDGKQAGTDEAADALADTVAMIKTHVRDSIGEAVLADARRDSINSAAVVASLIREKNEATRATNRAVELGRAIQDTLNALDAFPVGVEQINWRGRYVALSEAFDTLVAAVTRERQAREQERLTANRLAADDRARLLLNFDNYRQSVLSADSAKAKAFTANIQQAQASGKRTGRIQGFVLGLLTVVIVAKAGN